MKRIVRLALAAVIAGTWAFAASDKNDTPPVEISKDVQVQQARDEVAKIQKELSKASSVWIKSYNSYMAYQEARKNLRQIKWRIEELQNRRQTVERKLEIEALQAKEKILTDQVELLKAQGTSPFVSLLKPDEAGEQPTITNPFEIVTGLSYIKRLNSQYKDYLLREEELQELITLLERQVTLYKELIGLDRGGDYEVELEVTLLQVEKFKLGQATAVDLILTEERQTSAVLSLISAKQRYAVLLARLRYELGVLVDGRIEDDRRN